jgi:NAD(P)-dependent dehydrogenase (short-subunit alcohol dehydrogenase family)
MADIRLDGKIAIVTGAGQGLGRVMAAALADQGARVACADLNAKAAEDAAAEIEQRAGRDAAMAITGDINRLEDCERLVGECRARLGGLHVLVNAARRLHRGPGLPESGNSLRFWESDPRIWQETVLTNVVGTFFLSRTVTPHLIAQKWGRIINITTSNSGMSGARGSPYGLTKAALESATLIWAADLADTGVTVNSLLPGGSCANDPGRVTRSGKPLLPMDIMNDALLWLASDLSNGVTGKRFVGRLWDNTLPPNEAAAQAEEAPALPRRA